MMYKSYLSNYWPLFLDFIIKFRHLKYGGFILPLLTNFYQLLDKDLRDAMAHDDFIHNVNGIMMKNSDIQPGFEKQLGQFGQIPNGNNPHTGRILLNHAYLRFSANNYTEIFDPEKTVIIARQKRESYLGIPVSCLENTGTQVVKSSDQLIHSAIGLFESLKTHPVYGNEFFKNSFINNLPLMVQKIKSVNDYLEANPITCVIVGTTEDLTSRIFTMAAARKGIPSICMQHGIFGGDEAYLPVFTTVAAVFGNYERDWYKDRGLSESRVSVTGHPRFDDIFTQKHMSREQMLQKYGLDNGYRTVLFATQPFNEMLWNGFIHTMAGDDRNKGIQIIIKPHPYEMSRNAMMEKYREYAAKYPHIRLVTDRRANVYDILPNVDAVIGNLSTVILEAMLFGKPICILSERKHDYFMKIDDLRFSDPVKLSAHIAELVDSVDLRQQTMAKVEDFLAYAYPYKVSGRLVIEEIQRLAGIGAVKKVEERTT